MSRRGQPNVATGERRQVILAAALACFDEIGLAATTMEQIRDRARCSIGSLYHHFGSKEGVASALFIDGISDLNAGLLERLDHCGSAEDGVRTVVLHYGDWVTRQATLARFLLHSREIHFAPEAKAELKAIYQRHFGAVFSWFGRFVVRGEMKQLPPETYIPIISGPIEDYARLWLSGRTSTPLAEVAEVFADAAWNAVRAR
ncbi:MAG: TetR/AcrR family transcriptional regulator [Gammaproteobacteria bacterium]|nr:MAG: TetR/AcrR family transcriptional regulator [Gammaproteobacteria bacterium]